MVSIVFFGSDDFAAAHLTYLLRRGCHVKGCVTLPDRAQDRGWKVKASPVKAVAQAAGIPVWQPEDLKDEALCESLAGLAAEVFVVIAYGKFLPAALLAIPKICAVNAHGSLLPSYRGAAPINWAIINGETETGISVIRLNAAMDAGDILGQESCRIDPDDDAISLRVKLIPLGCRCLERVLDQVSLGTCIPQEQDSQKVTFAPKLTKDLGRINWRKSAREIHNLARGLLPWPAAYTFYGERMLKILKTEIETFPVKGEAPGQVMIVDKRGLIIATGDGALRVDHIHPADAKPMSAADFLRGQPVPAGHVFS
jgi:methionyl-tRNA formyltransferase